jgi:hypothetical protein
VLEKHGDALIGVGVYGNILEDVFGGAVEEGCEFGAMLPRLGGEVRLCGRVEQIVCAALEDAGRIAEDEAEAGRPVEAGEVL